MKTLNLISSVRFMYLHDHFLNTFTHKFQVSPVKTEQLFLEIVTANINIIIIIIITIITIKRDIAN